jgi:aspartyl-tRNA(Asn)/glutamyl-tRNA(Gln) amidotransferase subunit C
MSSASNITISKEEIIKLAKLSNIELETNEIDKYQAEVSTILEMIAKLKEIDTEGVEPTYQVSGNLSTLETMRKDEISNETVPKEELIKLAPRSSENEIKVPKVL